VSSSTAGTEEVQKSFPDCSELQLHRREMGGCPVYQVAGCKDEGFQKDSSKMLQRTGTVLENANKQCHNGAVSKRYRFFSQLKKEKNKCKVMYDGVVWKGSRNVTHRGRICHFLILSLFFSISSQNPAKCLSIFINN